MEQGVMQAGWGQVAMLMISAGLALVCLVSLPVMLTRRQWYFSAIALGLAWRGSLRVAAAFGYAYPVWMELPGDALVFAGIAWWAVTRDKLARSRDER